MAKIKQTEPATAILCNRCGGFIMCAIDQYMDEDDLALIESSRAEGKIIKRTDAKGVSKVFEECICKTLDSTNTISPDKVNTQQPQADQTNRPRKTILSLSKRSEK